MAVPVVKNKRLKMSPGGMITLPVAARKALAMEPGKGTRAGVAIDGGEVVLTTRYGARDSTWRISPKGLMQLRGEEKKLLESGKARHYWLKLDDDKQRVRLVPYR